MSERIPCCISGCGRTFKREADETSGSIIMCGRHWRMGDEALRNRHKQLRKRHRWFERKWKFRHKAIETSRERHKFDDAWNRAAWAAHRAWHRVKQDVEIKAALGAEDAPRRRPRVSA